MNFFILCSTSRKQAVNGVSAQRALLSYGKQQRAVCAAETNGTLINASMCLYVAGGFKGKLCSSLNPTKQEFMFIVKMN